MAQEKPSLYRSYSKYCQSNILHGKNTFSLQLQKNKGEHFGRKRDCYTLQTSNAKLPKRTSTYICTMLLLISFKTSCNCCCSFFILLLKSLFFCVLWTWQSCRRYFGLRSLFVCTKTEDQSKNTKILWDTIIQNTWFHVIPLNKQIQSISVNLLTVDCYNYYTEKIKVIYLKCIFTLSNWKLCFVIYNQISFGLTKSF